MISKIVTAAEAAARIPDNAFVAFSGVNYSGMALEVMDAILDRFDGTGHPANISLMHAGGCFFVEKFARPGLLGAYYAGFPKIGQEAISSDLFPVYSMSQGICTQLYRAQASDVPFLTRGGLNTFLDPRQGGGALNEKAAAAPIVELIQVGGEPFLHYTLPPITVALIRGTCIDDDGNLTNEDESVKHELLYLAMAAHSHGGLVIAQAKRRVKKHTLSANRVVVPGMLVDCAVICTDEEKWHPQNHACHYNPALSGELRTSEESIPYHIWEPTGEKRMIARRAALELRPGQICNVGIGTPDGLANIVAAEGVNDLFSMTVELGPVGGFTGGKQYFSNAFNPDAFLQHHEMFDLITGHGLDISFLGAGEIGSDGSVNVTRFNGKTNGSGGFVDIAANTRKVVFLTTLTVGGRLAAENGVLRVVQEGKPAKFVNRVGEISFNGPEAVRRGQEILYVTERAVFRLIHGHVTLTEIAPGLDVERDVIAQMGFRPEISPDLRTIDPICYSDGPLGLRKTWETILSDKTE